MAVNHIAVCFTLHQSQQQLHCCFAVSAHHHCCCPGPSLLLPIQPMINVTHHKEVENQQQVLDNSSGANSGPVEHPHASYMQRAIYLSRVAGLEKRTGGCFGAVVVKDGKIVGEGYNNVISKNDPTWHGEIGAIRDASARLGNPHLHGCVLYTSSEPCPMCMGACYWARIDKVYYATTANDVKVHGHFEDEDFYLEFAKPPADRNIPSVEFMREEAVKVWEEFSAMPDRCHY